MKLAGTQKVKLSQRISSAVASETPFRHLAGDFSKVAKSALDEANSLVVEEVRMDLKRLPSNLDGFRLVHLSDTHHSPFTDIEHIKRAIDIANDLNPDAFVLTGDYVSHEKEYIEPVANELGRLESEFGTYACLGNHDHWTDAPLVTKAFRGSGIRVLINEGFRFEARGQAFWMCGVDDYMAKRTDVAASLLGSFPDEMKILLAHNPVILRQAAKYGVDAMFSGHTHGGQIKLLDKESKRPTLRRKLTNGLHRRKDTQIYITRGIGTVVLPVRYQCPPEISLIELRCV
ncbi:MAG: metallophosphoesterase [Acidobacteriota bacterium]|nr:metallophosphoesterase [Acidobacteriota bacterium]MDH3528407.1 metallophosphoesterase [Acidobacteriota bacterium]